MEFDRANSLMVSPNLLLFGIAFSGLLVFTGAGIIQLLLSEALSLVRHSYGTFARAPAML